MKTVKTLIILLLLVMGYSLKHYPPPAKPIVVIDGSFNDDITLKNFSRERAARIRAASAPLLTPPCTEAFLTVGLRSPIEVVQGEGVVFHPSNDLYLDPARKLGLVDERTRHEYAMQFSSGRAQAGAVRAMLSGTRLTIDGKSHIFLHDTAFIGESFWLNTSSLRDLLIHEFIHLGGQPPTPGLFGPFQHDLAGYEYYGKLMQACQ